MGERPLDSEKLSLRVGGGFDLRSDMGEWDALFRTDERAQYRFAEGRHLSLTLANFAGSSAARDTKHRIVLDDLMSAFEHEFHASHVAKSCPAAFHI